MASAVSGSAATQTPAAVSGCPADCGRTAAEPQPPFRRDGSARARCVCSSALVRWARSTQPADIGCPDARTPDAACRTPRPWHCGHPRPPQGHADTAAAATLDSRQQNPSHTAAMSTGTDRNVRHRPAPPPDHQIRRLVLCVDLVSSRRICPAHVGYLVDRVGSRRNPSDRLDDQADDQATMSGVSTR